jgi:hypothetical protein
MEYLFGMWDTITDFVDEGQEALKYDLNGNYTGVITPTDPSQYTLQKVRSDESWYEVDTSQPLEPQLDIRQITQYVNPQAITNYRNASETLLSKTDLGGNTEKDRLMATEDASGIFQFGLAAPSMYRLVEWCIIDGKEEYLADMDNGSVEQVNGQFYYKSNPTPSNRNPKQLRCRRQQKGTFDILKNVEGSKLVLVGENFYASDPSSGVGFANGETYRLKFATRQKKIYLKRPMKGGTPKYVDIFVVAGGLADLNSMGMMAKVTPVIMLAQQLEQGGAKVRIYGLRAYYVSGTQTGSNRSDTYYVYYSWVAKEYGAPIDINTVATAIADPRFFRYAMWMNTEGISRRKYGVRLSGYGTTLYDRNDLINGFALYRNYLMDMRQRGVNRSLVTNKALFITGGLPSPRNNYSSNENAIRQEYYRISDIAEIVLADNADKAIRKIIQRDKNRNMSNTEIRNRLLELLRDAFYSATTSTTNTSQYEDTDETITKTEERRTEINQIINRLLL